MKAKKVMALVLAAVMLICATVAATVAYLKDDDSVVNTFTVGKVFINLDEYDYDNDDNEEDNVTVNGKVRDKANKYHLLPGQTYSKDPTVTVLKDSDECYVRMLVTIVDIDGVKAAFGDDFLPQNFVEGWENEKWLTTRVVTLGTTEITVNENGNAVKRPVNTATYEFRYAETVNAKNEAKVLEPLFTHIVMPDEMTNTQAANLTNVRVDVVAHAIQAAGFTDAADAWSHWS